MPCVCVHLCSCDTCRDSDKIIVMDDGRVVEYDSPVNLLRDADSMFSGARASPPAHTRTARGWHSPLPSPCAPCETAAHTRSTHGAAAMVAKADNPEQLRRLALQGSQWGTKPTAAHATATADASGNGAST